MYCEHDIDRVINWFIPRNSGSANGSSSDMIGALDGNIAGITGEQKMVDIEVRLEWESRDNRVCRGVLRQGNAIELEPGLLWADVQLQPEPGR